MSVGVVLAINTGSSSVKIAGYRNEAALSQLFRLTVEVEGQPGAASIAALDRAQQACGFRVDAVGHRVVHGGAMHAEPVPVTARLLADLQQLVAIDPGQLFTENKRVIFAFHGYQRAVHAIVHRSSATFPACASGH